MTGTITAKYTKYKAMIDPVGNGVIEDFVIFNLETDRMEMFKSDKKFGRPMFTKP